MFIVRKDCEEEGARRSPFTVTGGGDEAALVKTKDELTDSSRTWKRRTS